VTPPAADLGPATAHDRLEFTMDLDDTARVRAPRDAVEHRLGTVTDITYAPYSTYIRRLRLRFPTGVERTYTTAEIRPCGRDDDHAALVAAVTEGCRALRDVCRIAHDHDGELSADISVLLMSLVTTADARLGVTIDPASLPEPAGSADADGNRS
jgi:hypothetical protein